MHLTLLRLKAAWFEAAWFEAAWFEAASILKAAWFGQSRLVWSKPLGLVKAASILKAAWFGQSRLVWWNRAMNRATMARYFCS
jgi:hypothetical protein